ncbi:hypothetical protein [Actinoplanes sp. URMC 104]|uniref:hypothetical protein n=1 Tax=Actinoplanes sp. URMC 104 TaxID=3423409 RepID=UPI003F1D454E
MADNSAARDVATLRLPGIGWLLQWRSDGFWRDLSDAQDQDERAGVHTPAEDDWVRWSGHAAPHARGGAWGGTTTWWLVYGELPGSTAPTVELADGTRPPVLQVGRVWACEWHAAAQPVSVHVENERFDLPFIEPSYRRSMGAVSESESQGRAARGWFTG